MNDIKDKQNKKTDRKTSDDQEKKISRKWH